MELAQDAAQAEKLPLGIFSLEQRRLYNALDEARSRWDFRRQKAISPCLIGKPSPFATSQHSGQRLRADQRPERPWAPPPLSPPGDRR